MNEDRTRSSGQGPGRLLVVLAVVLAVAAVFVVKANRDSRTAEAAAEQADVALPRLVDIGADKCVACKMMAPILEELRLDYAGQVEVVFVDVWKNRSAAGKYGVTMIPTQVFYDQEGKEVFRHEGFYSKEDILTVWREHGFLTDEKPPSTPEKGA